VHLNGRVYDPLIGRMMSADPMVPDPLNAQAWNRYSYVINNPLAFTDPNGYCFLGMCSWGKAISTFFGRSFGALFRKYPIFGELLEIGAVLLCGGNPVCAVPVAFATTTFVAGVTSGNLGYALKAGFIAAATAAAFYEVGEITSHMPGAIPGIDGSHGTFEPLSEAHLANIAGHAAVGCASAAASGGKCGAGALSAGVPAVAGPAINGRGFASLVANSTLGGLASVAGGGKFANGAATAAFGYLLNDMALIWGHGGVNQFNPFGHIGIAIEGFGMYSYGNSTPLGSDTTDYVESQSQLRGQTVVTIPTTPEQDEKAFKYLQQFPDKNGVTPLDNCACRVQGALDAAGIPRLFLLEFLAWPLVPAMEVARGMSAGGQSTYYPRYTTPPNMTRFNPSPWP
jgi:hypothetical protein